MRYWIYWNDLVQGPFEVQELASLRAFTADLPVCEEDRQDWMPAAAVSDLLPYFQPVLTAEEPVSAAPPPPPPPSRPPCLSPLQGEFFSEPAGQQPLFDLNGSRNYVFKPIEDAAAAPEAAPPWRTPFFFRVYTPPVIEPSPTPSPAEEVEFSPPPVPFVAPEREVPVFEESGSGAVEPEELHPSEPPRVETPRPLVMEEPFVLVTEEPVVEVPRVPVQEETIEEIIIEPSAPPAPPPLTVPSPEKVFRAPRVAIPDFETSRRPTVEEPQTRLWPWVAGVWLALGLIGFGFYHFLGGRSPQAVKTSETPTTVSPVVAPPVQQSVETPVVAPPVHVPLPTWQALTPADPASARSLTPVAVMVDPQGQVWVADPIQHQLQAAQVSEVAGALQTSAGWDVKGPSGAEPGQFHAPNAIVSDSQGHVWVADKGNNRVQMYDPATQKWTVLGQTGNAAGQFNAPASVAVDPQGHIWVADKANHRLQTYDPVTQQWTAVGQHGTEPGQFNYPAGVAVDAQGVVWVADQGNNRLQAYNPATAEWKTYGQKGKAVGAFNAPTAVAVDTHGRVWVAEQGNHRVQVYNPRTERWLAVGKLGRKTGEFNSPSGIAFDSKGRVWVADRGNRRVQVARSLTVAPLAAGKQVKQLPAAAPVVPDSPPAAPVPAEMAAAVAPAEKPAAVPAVAPPAVPGLSETPASANDKWRGKEMAAIDLVLQHKIYAGKRTVGENAKMILDEQHDKELLHAGEMGERLYLPDKISWMALREEGARYRVYLNFQAMQASGERVLAGSNQFIVNLQRKTVEPADDATRHDYFDPAAMPVYQHSAKADEIQTLLNGVDVVNKHRLHAVILKSSKQKDEKKKVETDLQAAEDKLQKEVVYFRTKYAEKTLQNVGKAYNSLAVLNGK